MKYLNLNKQFIFEPEVINSQIYFPTNFEHTIRVDQCDSETIITTRIKHDRDIFMIALAADAARRQGAKSLKLILPFVPNARQDRSTVIGDAFGLKVFADFINSLKFDRVCVFDPHSPAVELLINNCVAVPSWEFVRQVLPKDIAPYKLCAPDAGAVKKTEILSHIVARDYVICNKKRIPTTGQIVDIQVFGSVDRQRVYIVDDICDGGGTFVGLAKKLYELGASEVHLVVSHGIFSKGIDVLWNAGIKSIHTTNSYDSDANIGIPMDVEVLLDEYLYIHDIRNLLAAYLNN